MPPIIATLLCGTGILGLFFLDRDRKAKAPWALMIPFVWLCISASRTASQWFGNVDTGSADQILEGSPVDALIFAGLIALALMVLVARRRRILPALRGNVPLLLFFSYCAISFLWSDYPVVALKRWFKAVGDLSIILIILTDAAPCTAVRRVFGRAGFLLVPLSILLIRYYPNLGRTYGYWNGEAYNIGVATGKNGLGYVCLMCGLASFWCFREALRSQEGPGLPRKLLAHGTILAMVLYLFHVARSATSFGCFIVGCGLIMIVKRRRHTLRPAWLHILVGGVMFLVLYVLVLDPGIGLLDVMGRDSTLTGRTRLWAQVLRVPVNPLVGTGYESFWLGDRLASIWKANWEHPTQAHNGYLELYVDLGWIGLALAATFMISGYRNIVGALRTDLGLPALRLAYFVVAAIYNFTEHAFRELHPVWIMLLLATTMVRASSSSEGVDARASASPDCPLGVHKMSPALAAHPFVIHTDSALDSMRSPRSSAQHPGGFLEPLIELPTELDRSKVLEI